jgi:hypothetical protein
VQILRRAGLHYSNRVMSYLHGVSAFVLLHNVSPQLFLRGFS